MSLSEKETRLHQYLESRPVYDDGGGWLTYSILLFDVDQFAAFVAALEQTERDELRDRLLSMKAPADREGILSSDEVAERVAEMLLALSEDRE